MKERRTEALKMRLKGYSYSEINAALEIPKATLSGWLRDIVLSDSARARLKQRTREGGVNALIKRNILQTVHAEKRAFKAQQQACAEIGALSDRDLRIVGATLYWAEGYKRLKVRGGKERVGHSISFVNSDAEMVRVFVRFSREILGISEDHMKVSMRLYAHINEQEAMRHWIRVTGLPESSFRKTSYLVTGASKGIRPFNRLPWGTVQVQISNTAKFHHILGLIEGVKKGL